MRMRMLGDCRCININEIAAGRRRSTTKRETEHEATARQIANWSRNRRVIELQTDDELAGTDEVDAESRLNHAPPRQNRRPLFAGQYLSKQPDRFDGVTRYIERMRLDTNAGEHSAHVIRVAFQRTGRDPS